MGPNRRAQDRERAAAEPAAKAKRLKLERKAATEAQKIVAIRNARQAGGVRCGSIQQSAPGYLGERFSAPLAGKVT
jgi:hypothetical protein